MMIINSLVISLLLTIIIEYFIIKIFNIKDKVFIDVILVNILTNPILVFTINICNVYGFKYTKILEIVLEFIVIFVEGYVYTKIIFDNSKKAYFLSAIANVSAYIIGLILIM